MTLPETVLLFVAGVLGGALNSVAGGGSFIAFPALVFTGADAICANASNTVALWPGSIASAGAFRREQKTEFIPLVVLGAVSLVGGYLGAILLLETGKETFEFLLPWLLLGATLLFTIGPRISASMRSKSAAEGASSRFILLMVGLLQFVIAIYGGYFGGGIGILMLAALSVMGMTEIHKMNALKTVLGSLINGAAVLTFVASGRVLWPQVSMMIVGAALGGYFGAHYSMRLNPGSVRRFVIVIGFTMTAIFFYKYSA